MPFVRYYLWLLGGNLWISLVLRTAFSLQPDKRAYAFLTLYSPFPFFPPQHILQIGFIFLNVSAILGTILSLLLNHFSHTGLQHRPCWTPFIGKNWQFFPLFHLPSFKQLIICESIIDFCLACGCRSPKREKFLWDTLWNVFLNSK